MPEFIPGGSIMSGAENPLKWRKPKGKGPPTATGNEIRTGNGTEKGSGKVGNTEGKRPEESP
ncbi:hypothetical protein, partial [Streptomyces thermolilacinus]|uniref:hypothetical protein n=1 Tax=Streptomyces thermolilacinus TaxID=285540 RepID=UPI0033D80144